MECAAGWIDSKGMMPRTSTTLASGETVRISPEKYELVPGRPINCPLCKRASTELDLIGTHVKTHGLVHYASVRHFLQESKEAKDGKDGCPFCGLKPELDLDRGLYRSDLLIRQHIFICPKRPFQCPFEDCQKAFSWANHIRADICVAASGGPVAGGPAGGGGGGGQPLAYHDVKRWWKILNIAWKEHLVTDCAHTETCPHPGCFARSPMPMPRALLHSNLYAAVRCHIDAALDPVGPALHRLMQRVYDATSTASIGNLLKSDEFKASIGRVVACIDDIRLPSAAPAAAPAAAPVAAAAATAEPQPMTDVDDDSIAALSPPTSPR